MTPRSDLSPARRGYAYQDMTAAFACAELLASLGNSITIDRKAGAGDIFDDITVRGRDRVSRRQIKFGSGGDRTLDCGDFTRTASPVRIDKLLLSYLETFHAWPHCESRLAVTWRSPTGDPLLNLLRVAEAGPSLPTVKSRRFRLIPERIWPAEELPLWAPLRNAPSITRDDFLRFADNFIIETDLPSFSQDLAAPGELEQILFRYLEERIGVGIYPNSDRTVEDVAARLMALATWARTERATLSATDVARAIELQVDYGQVPQRSPIEAEHLVARGALMDTLRQKIRNSSRIRVVGPPGSGKSWGLSAFADSLREEGVLVARHYCYLRPGDEDEDRRITTNVMFGNLVGELINADPGLAEEKERVYAADSRELESVLRAAADKYTPNPVVLIVDGIDHISRVLSRSRSVRVDDTDIVEELAALTLPAGVCLVLGSQPGSHLDPLRGLGAEICISPWHPSDVAVLADRFSLRAAVGEGEDYPALLELLASRASGNPLYATFLIKGIKACLAAGDFTAADWLAATPVLQGEIAEYYKHLYDGSDVARQVIAQVLGVIDFAVTEEELSEIVDPLVAQHLGRVLRILQPILVEVVGQGGLRVFHESFRRFITERLAADGLSSNTPLDFVIKWLKGLGFPAAPRAYRHLLPALRRAGRIEELLAHVGPDFVSAGVEWGYTRDLIQKNLSLAAETAAGEQRWPELVRCSELFRALHTCFEEHMSEPFAYWQNFVGIMGPGRAADRLLFEGAPTLDRHLGLWLCSLIDDAEAIAPWDRYLALPPQPFAGRDGSTGAIEWKGRVIAALLHGRLRREGVEPTLERARRELLGDLGELEPPVVIAIAERLVRSAPIESVRKLAEDESIPATRRALLWLALARESRRRGDVGAGAKHADHAAGLDRSPNIIEEALLLGVRELPADYQLPDPRAIDIELDSNNYHVKQDALSAWVSCIRIVAFLDPTRLEQILGRLQGEGWYRSWLRYVVEISRAEALKEADPRAASQVAVVMFRELARDADPVAGRPRAMDLVMAGRTIQKTLARGLALLDGDADWASALASLAEAVDGTESHLSGIPWGPINHDTVVELFEPFAASRPELKPLILRGLKDQLRTAEEKGELFAVHLDLELAAVRACVAMGEPELALGHWRQAAVYFGAYGQRKDATLYELLRGVQALTTEERMEALEMLFPLARAVVEHTDGKGTRDLPNACVRKLAAINPSAALQVAILSQMVEGGSFGWVVEEAAHDAILAAHGQADPQLVVLGQETLPFHVDDVEEAEAEVGNRFAAIEELAAADPEMARNALCNLAARVEGDHHQELPEAAQPINDLATRLGIRHALSWDAGPASPAGLAQPPGQATTPGPGAQKPASVRGKLRPVPAPPSNATPVHLMTWIRENVSHRYDEEARVSIDELVNRIGYVSLVLSDAGKEEAAVRLLRFVLRHAWRYDPNGATVLADLGEGFERYGYRRLAAVAMTLAFAGSRGGRGWDSFGGDEHAEWLRRALSIDPVETRSTLAATITALIPGGYITGVTPGIMKRLASWGEAATASSCWREAYEVIRHRLPTKMAAHEAALQFHRSETEPWSVEEALVGLMIARVSHPELSRKRSALLALARVIKKRPDAVVAPLAKLLSQDGAPTSSLLLLTTLWDAEEAPFVITRGIKNQLELLATIDLYAERMLARQLLERSELSAPTSVPCAPTIDRAAEERHFEMAIALDWGERVDQIAKFWPEFPDVLARRFEQEYFDRREARARGKDRYEYSSRRESLMPFWVPILGWEKEILEQAFQEALNGVRPHLWSQGAGTAGLDVKLLGIALPRIRLQLAVEASRSVRPRLPRPSEAEATEAVERVLPENDEYPGWCRLGWYEEELVFEHPKSPWGDPAEIVYTAGGLVAGPPESVGEALPFVSCDPKAWFPGDIDFGPAEVNLRGIMGGVVGAAWLDDLLEKRLILVPPTALAVRYGLRPGPWPGPFKWVDDEGEHAVVLRVWRVRSINSGSEEPCILDGCELIVRPEMFHRIEVDSGYSLTMAIRTRRQAVPRKETRTGAR